MQNSRRFRLGLYVLGAGALFVSLLLFLAQSSFHGERASYFIMFDENVKGMVAGSKVNFQGVPIGVVADLRFQDGRTLVELRVDPTRAAIQDVTARHSSLRASPPPRRPPASPSASLARASSLARRPARDRPCAPRRCRGLPCPRHQ